MNMVRRCRCLVPTKRRELVDETYLVTIVLTGSSMPVGVMMNQNNMLVMLTIQRA